MAEPRHCRLVHEGQDGKAMTVYSTRFGSFKLIAFSIEDQKLIFSDSKRKNERVVHIEGSRGQPIEIGLPEEIKALLVARFSIRLR